MLPSFNIVWAKVANFHCLARKTEFTRAWEVGQLISIKAVTYKHEMNLCKKWIRAEMDHNFPHIKNRIQRHISSKTNVPLIGPIP